MAKGLGMLNLNLTSVQEVLHLMEIGDVWIERTSATEGFFYLVERQSGHMLPINQALAKSLVHHHQVTQQRWYQGWGSPKPTKIMRWVHVNCDDLD